MAIKRYDLLQGTLEMLILKTLSAEKLHGFGIATRIHDASNNVLKIEDGSLYPALYRMERRGWIKSEWGMSELKRRGKYYTLTAKGRRHLKGEAEAWERLSNAVWLIMRPEPQGA